MARCSGREHPSGLTFAPSTKGRTRCVPNRYCGSRTSISPNFVCQRSFFHLGDASEGVDESPAPSPPPGSRPNCAAPPVPTDASPPQCALPQRRLPSIPPRRLRPPAQSTRPACEAPDAPAKDRTVDIAVEFLWLAEGRGFRGEVAPQRPAALRTGIAAIHGERRYGVEIAVGCPFGHGAGERDDDVLGPDRDRLAPAVAHAENLRYGLSLALDLHGKIMDARAELSLDALFAEPSDQRPDKAVVLVVFREHQRRHVLQAVDQVEEAVHVELHFQKAVPVLEGKHGPPKDPEIALEQAL